MKKKIIPVLVVIALIAVVIGVTALVSLIKKYTPSREHEDLSVYYELSENDEVAIVLNNELLETKAKVIDGYIYVDYEFVHEYLNARFYWDENENILLYATAQNLISAQADATSYLVTKSTVDYGHTVVTATADSAYIDLDFVKEYSDFIYTYVQDPHRIILTNEWGEYSAATLKKDSYLRVKGGIKSPILKDVTAKEEVTVLETGDKWTKVATADGIIGYLQNRVLSDAETKTAVSEYTEEAFAHITKDFEICMAWHQVTTQSANSTVATVLASTKGVNVLSPTWFYLNDNDGGIADLASLDYVNYCHNQGVEVWALVSNLENTEVDTAEVLTHTSKRQNLVNQIVSAAIQYNLDGINLDFEALSREAVGDAYIEFVRELSIKCKNNGIVLSVDNYVPTEYTSFYNRTEQANFADYVVVMGYDEHYAGSSAGSVASLSWVTQGVSDTLDEVPAEQIILGMPFYTRVWEMPIESVEAETDNTAADSSVTSTVYGMTAAYNFINQHGATVSWLEDYGQNYAEFTDGDTLYKVWLEDENSMKARLELVEEKELAGASFWKLGFEKSEVWDTIIKYVG